MPPAKEMDEKAVAQLLRHAPPDLKAAVNSTLDVRRAVSAFRNVTLRVVEKGDLFEHMKRWYVETILLGSSEHLSGYPEALVDNPRNMYSVYRSKHKISRKFQELDFLLHDVPRDDERLPMTLGYKLKPDEVEQLLMDLSGPEGKLAKLITVNPYITHEENLHIAVLDARLWLCNSEFPVEVIPGSPSYKAIRWDGAPAERQIRDIPPSKFHVSRREVVVECHWNKLDRPQREEVYYLSPMDFEDQGCHLARVARVGLAVLSTPGRGKKEVAAALLGHSGVEDADSKARFLEGLKACESEYMSRILALRIYDSVPGDKGGFLRAVKDVFKRI